MILADLHIHSRFSRATSRDGDAPHLDLWARYKGLGIVGTGDFTHPEWRKELAEMLEEAGEGVFALKKDKGATSAHHPRITHQDSGE